MQLVLLSGVSGSGKSVALKALEDAGFFCVDNLPAELFAQLADYCASRAERRVAVSADARARTSLAELPEFVARERARGTDVRVIFLDASDDSLVRRFAETRRPHPLAEDGRSIAEAINGDRELLAPVAEIGQRIDTSALTPAQLRRWIQDLVATDRLRLTLCFQSFGYKGGVPLDADFVFDTRFLSNPHYDPHLRHLTGNDPEVIAFLERETQAEILIEDIQRFLQRWLPSFVLDQRASINVAIGCTGGRHRSVYIAERLAARFRPEHQVVLRHRDLRSE